MLEKSTKVPVTRLNEVLNLTYLRTFVKMRQTEQKFGIFEIIQQHSQSKLVLGWLAVLKKKDWG